MSDTDYLKCLCQICGGSIEFPQNGIGEIVECPHCGGQTKLVSTADNSPPKSGGKGAVIVVSILMLFILVAAGLMLYWFRKPEISPQNPAAEAVTNSIIPQAFTQMNDFKIGKITLKKTEGSGLVYAVGTVKNDTARQRFGVKIELDLLDGQDNKIGSTSDYIEVMEPHKEWQFKALLTDPKTVSAKLINIEEQK